MSATAETHDYGITRTVSTGYEETIARVRELLKEEGFGVLTEIDVKRTLKEKIDKDVEPYVILGACNPRLASRALELEPDIGLLLPCNVIVSRRGNETHVGVVNPQSMVEFTSNSELAEVSHEADARLRRVIDKL
ncbi:MAG: DUF302 domain-containing protein [Dehalococcoidia bacterium]|nr:MAG: DUF302 domain-containing protein [Dehalococcoidia bacterium]